MVTQGPSSGKSGGDKRDVANLGIYRMQVTGPRQHLHALAGRIARRCPASRPLEGQPVLAACCRARHRRQIPPSSRR
ncbi:MAG: hypothetical protein U1E38_01635 [Rhodospirillales bacterium]